MDDFMKGAIIKVVPSEKSTQSGSQRPQIDVAIDFSKFLQVLLASGDPAVPEDSDFGEELKSMGGVRSAGIWLLPIKKIEDFFNFFVGSKGP